MSINLDRPARRQVKRNPNERPTIDMDQTGSYNIWYHRFQGDRRKRQPLEKATTRCNLAKDSGRTRGRDPGGAFCVHFARGCCDRGSECAFLHRLPTAADRIGNSTDCFGRERHRDERDDMGGVGSFEKDNRTLYVGNISQSRDMEEVIRKHFEEWGEIERLNVLTHKGVAFVRYAVRANAEFAKEAMYGQSLDSEEVLNVRWAVEDPNPRAQAAKAEATDALVTAAVLSKLPQIGPEGTILDYDAYKYGYVEQPDPEPTAATEAVDPNYAYSSQAYAYDQNGGYDANAAYAQQYGGYDYSADPAWAAYYASMGYGTNATGQAYQGYDSSSYAYSYPQTTETSGEGGEQGGEGVDGGGREEGSNAVSSSGKSKRPAEAEADADDADSKPTKKAKSDALSSLVASYDSGDEDDDADDGQKD
ncbi:Pre-mRNA-splicing factor [Rhizophlyctis rosea]|nr:Pre-mRNA-splicing factor [Rhizophlyctis rosea]